MNAKEYAVHCGVAQGTVMFWIKIGRLDGAWTRQGRFYKIDPAKADAIISGSCIQDSKRNPLCEHYTKCLSKAAYASWGSGKLDCRGCPDAEIRSVNELSEMQNERSSDYHFGYADLPGGIEVRFDRVELE